MLLKNVNLPANYKGYSRILKVLIVSSGVWYYAVDIIRGCFTFVPVFSEAKTEEETKTNLPWNYSQFLEVYTQAHSFQRIIFLT